MTQDIKVGDKVAIKQSHHIDINGYLETIAIGEIGEVKDVSDYDVDVYFKEYYTTLTLPKYQVDPIFPTDRKIAFLQKLSALLKEYDATICGGLSDIHGNDVLCITIGEEELAYIGGNTSADTIMDFEKE